MSDRLLYLAQSDTTVGFLSKDSKKLDSAKCRDENKSYILAIDSLALLKKSKRIPYFFKNYARRAKVTIAFSGGVSYRVIRKKEHLRFIKKFEDGIYTTSANLSGHKFFLEFALNQVDVALFQKGGFFESTPSKILKVGRKNIKRLR